MQSPPPIRRRAPRRGRIHWIISVLIAATAGAAGFLVGGFEYWASVDMVVDDANLSTTELDNLRRDLLDHAWQEFGTAGAQWHIGINPPARTITARASASNPAKARALITNLTTAFIEHIRKTVEEARTHPEPVELVLAGIRQERISELERLEAQVRRIESSLPEDDSVEADTRLRGQLSERREVYQHSRGRVEEVEAQLAAVIADPLPERAAVDPEARACAIKADVETRQDLKALHVQLAEARHQLLQVGQVAGPALDKLIAAGGRLGSRCSQVQACSVALELRRAVERLEQSLADYRAVLTGFAQRWSMEFDCLGTLADDPRRAEVIGVQVALCDALSGFLFQTTVPLATMREQVGAVSTASAASAEHHELASALVRGFHTFQTAHHRFEFAAGDMKASNNFRLDAALKSARGLRYRSSRRLAQIEERLACQALQDLRDLRTWRIAALEEQLRQLRHELDTATEAWIVAQEQADEHTPAMHNYLRSKTTAAAHAEQIASIKHEVGQIEIRLNNLAAGRMDVINPDHIAVADCRVDRWPVNLAAKLLQGAFAAVAVLVFSLGLRRHNPQY